jgi:hypothetical protein
LSSGLFVFLLQIVQNCPFFYFLNMQQSWAGQSKQHSKNKATAAQQLLLFWFQLFRSADKDYEDDVLPPSSPAT